MVYMPRGAGPLWQRRLLLVRQHSFVRRFHTSRIKTSSATFSECPSTSAGMCIIESTQALRLQHCPQMARPRLLHQRQRHRQRHRHRQQTATIKDATDLDGIFHSSARTGVPKSLMSVLTKINEHTHELSIRDGEADYGAPLRRACPPLVSGRFVPLW